MPASTLLYFLGASIALTVAPGPDNLFVLSQGISRGRRAAVVTAWGMCSGITVHTLAAALGISAVFYSSAIAFEAVKFAGAGYLAYLAFKAIREPEAAVERRGGDPRPALAHFRRGFIMNVLNPKVALFFLAFLPQFTAPGRGAVWAQMICLGLLFMAQGFAIFTAIGWFSGTLGNWLIQKPGTGRYFSWLSGAILFALALRLVIAER